MLRIVALALILIVINCQSSCEPFGLRIYYGDVVTDPYSQQKLVIYFNTKQTCNDSYVSWTLNGIKNISCSTKAIVASSFMMNYIAYIHVCPTSDVPFEQSFSYTVYGWNATTQINPTQYKEQSIAIKLIDPRVSSRSLKLVVLADWGKIQTNIMTPITDYLKGILNTTEINAVMVAGDIAYGLDTFYGKTYQDFLNLMQEFSPRLPFFLTPGNHQRRTVDAALLFNETFKVYGVDKKLASGIYFGSVFLTIFDPYNLIYGKTQSVSSLNALKTQLQKGLQSGRFIIPYSHYALHCSAQYSQCLYNYNRFKIYLDPMFDNGVKLYIGAHTHSYERSYPLYRNGSFISIQTPYSSGQYLISIVQGVSGNNKSIMTAMPFNSTLNQTIVQPFTAKYTVNETGFGVIQSTTQYVTYEHYSTKQGFMDKLIINLPTSNKASKSTNKILLGVAIGIVGIMLISITKVIMTKVLQPKPKVQIKSDKVDVTQIKDSLNHIVEDPKILITVQ